MILTPRSPSTPLKYSPKSVRRGRRRERGGEREERVRRRERGGERGMEKLRGRKEEGGREEGRGRREGG